MNKTVIEYRRTSDNKLVDMVFDEPQHSIQAAIDTLLQDDVTDITVVENPNNFTLYTN
jgi:hypothetical protein